MKCNKVHKNLLFYIDGELSSDKTEEIYNHLMQCSECRKLYKQIAGVWNSAKEEKIPYQPFFYTRVEQGLKNNKAKEQSILKRYGKVILQPAIYFIVLGLGIFIGVQLGQGVQSQQQVSSNEVSSRQEFIEAYADSNFINGMQLESLETEMVAQEQPNEKGQSNE
ncbi:MAG: zf-HC2 domain-containing protein [Bacteroidota bacterium]